MRAFLSYGAAWNWLKEAGRKERAEQVRVSNPELSAEVDRLMGQPESALRHLDWQLRRLIGGDPVEQLISGVQGFEGIVNRLPIPSRLKLSRAPGTKGLGRLSTEKKWASRFSSFRVASHPSTSSGFTSYR